MNLYEKLENLIPGMKITYMNMPDKLKGLTCRDEIYLNTNLINYYHTTPILAEEVAHYLTSNGDITDYKDINNMKQEVVARRYAHKLIIPLHKLIECYELGLWGDIYEMCMHLEIDRSYFKKVIEEYKKIYGAEVKYRDYIIQFEPLNIFKEVNK